MGSIVLLVLLTVYAGFLGPEHRLTEGFFVEGGLIESLQAAFFLVGSASFVGRGIRRHHIERYTNFFVAALLFFGFGEEVSWGVMSLHDTALVGPLLSQFAYWMIGTILVLWFVAIPILLSKREEVVGLPIPPLPFVFLVVLAIFIERESLLWLTSSAEKLSFSSSEVRELVFGASMLALGQLERE